MGFRADEKSEHYVTLNLRGAARRWLFPW